MIFSKTFANLADIGIVKDVDERELPPSAWTDGRNVRFINNAVEKFTGHGVAYGTPSAAPYYATPVVKGANYFWVYASLAGLYSTDGTTHYDITTLSATYAATADINWTSAHLGGGVLVMNNGIDAPQSWTGTSISDRFTALANWPAGMIARRVRPFKQFLFAADIDEGLGSGRNNTLLRWSHPATPGAVPTSWDHTDPTKDAGRVEISQTADGIVDMLTLRDTLFIYKANSTWSAQFIGGRNKFSFRSVFSQFGLLSARCAKDFFGRHVVLTSEDVIIHDGQNVEQVLHKRLRNWLTQTIDGTYYPRSFVTVNHNKNEIWICFPESGATFPNLAIIWNWKDGGASIRELPTGTTHIAYGLVDLGSSEQIDLQSGTIDSWSGAIDQENYSGAAQYLLMADGSRTLFYRGDNTEQFNAVNMTAYVSRETLPLIGNNDDINVYKTIHEIYPVIEGTNGGVVNIYVGRRNFLGDVVSWDGPFAYTIGTTVKVNCRAHGRIINIKFESTTNITWALQRYTVRYTVNGTR